MSQKIQALLNISIIVLVFPLWQYVPLTDDQVLITISGIITGPGNVPVINATVGAWLPTDIGDSTITNSQGYYELIQN